MYSSIKLQKNHLNQENTFDTEYRIQFLGVGIMDEQRKCQNINYYIYNISYYIYNKIFVPILFSAHEKTVFCILYSVSTLLLPNYERAFLRVFFGILFANRPFHVVSLHRQNKRKIASRAQEIFFVCTRKKRMTKDEGPKDKFKGNYYK